LVWPFGLTLQSTVISVGIALYLVTADVRKLRPLQQHERSIGRTELKSYHFHPHGGFL
jgi:hypothetical protein